MKLKAAQLKALDDSDFGLPGQRRYPMPDKQHVRSAIQFFKYAKPEERKELAKNINRKAKEYGMKFNVHGEFSKYASPDIISVDKEASNVGVLEPIVGGANIPHEKDIPKFEDKDADAVQKALGFMVTESLCNNTNNEEFIGFIRNHHDFQNGLMQYRDEGVGIAPTNAFQMFDDYIARIIVNKEEKDNAAYYALNSYPKGPSTLKERIAYARGNSLRRVVDLVDAAMKRPDDAQFSINMIADIISGEPDKEDIIALLGAVYNRSNDVNLTSEVIKALSIMPIKHRVQFSDIISQAEPNDITPAYDEPDVLGMTDSEIAEIDALTRKVTPEEIYSIFCHKLGIGTGNFTLASYGRSGYIMMGDLIGKRFGETGYYVHYDGSNVPTLFIRGKLTRQAVMPAMVYKNGATGTVEVALLDLDTKEISDRFTIMESGNRIMNRILDAAKGIRFSKNGDLFIDLKDKLSFDHYNELHRAVMENINTENVSAMKENAAYIFSIITTIEKEYTFNKSIDRTSKTFLDMQRLRGLFVSDFKLLMRNITKHDRKFDFVKFYAESRYNQSMIRIDKRLINLITTIFMKSMSF